jgi:hypothetical protein
MVKNFRERDGNASPMVIMGETPILCRVTQYFDRYGMVQRRSTSDHPKSYSVTRSPHPTPKRIPQRTLSACEPHGIFSSQVTTSDFLNVYPKNAVCLRTSKAIGPHTGSLTSVLLLHRTNVVLRLKKLVDLPPYLVLRHPRCFHLLQIVPVEVAARAEEWMSLNAFRVQSVPLMREQMADEVDHYQTYIISGAE